MSVIPSLESCQHPGGRRARGSRPDGAARPALERLEERVVPDSAGITVVPGSLPAASAAANGATAAQQTRYLLQLYRDLMHRTPGTSEVGYWQNAFGQGATRDQIAAGLYFSAEHLGAELKDYYQAYLGRQPGDGELAWWVGRLQAGTGGRDVEAAFLRSDEFYGRYASSDADWINAVYKAALGRDADAGGQIYWGRQLQRGVTHDAVIASLLTSRESNRRLVTTLYETFLRREPDGSGLATWTSALATGRSPQQFIVQLVSSSEYFRGTYNDFPDYGHVVGAGTLTLDPKPGTGRAAGTGDPGAGSGKGGGTGTGTGDTAGKGGKGSGTGNNNGPPRVLARDLNVSGRPGSNYAELQLAVNPTNPDNIVIFAGLAEGVDNPNDVFFSFDGGITFGRNRIDQTVDGINTNFRFDPAVTFDDNGRCYIVYGADDNAGSINQGTSWVVVGRSADGGRTFTTTIITQDNKATTFNDKWFITAGPAPGNSAQQDVYVGWDRVDNAANAGQPGVVAGSIDGGVTFTAPVRFTDSPRAIGVSPAVGPNGELYVSYLDLNTNTVKVDVATTFNGTAGSFNFGVDTLAATARNQNFTTPIPSQPNRGIGTLPVLDVDRSSGPNTGTLYIVYADLAVGGAAPDFDIFLVRSIDKNRTWSAPLRVNDDTTRTSQFNPAIAVDNQGSGCVGVTWRDARLDPANQKVDVFVATSTDGGLTFGANTRVSDAPSDESTDPDPNDYLEYDGFDFVMGKEYHAWSDNSLTPNGNKQVFFDSETAPECGVGTPDDPLEPNETSDRPTDLGVLRVGDSRVLANLNINRHPNRLPDYDWYRLLPAQDGTVTVTIGPTAGNLELQLFTADAHGTLIPVAADVLPGRAAKSVTARFRQSQVILIEVKGINTRPGVFGQGAYQLNVNFT